MAFSDRRARAMVIAADVDEGRAVGEHRAVAFAVGGVPGRLERGGEVGCNARSVDGHGRVLCGCGRRVAEHEEERSESEEVVHGATSAMAGELWSGRARSSARRQNASTTSLKGAPTV